MRSERVLANAGRQQALPLVVMLVMLVMVLVYSPLAAIVVGMWAGMGAGVAAGIERRLEGTRDTLGGSSTFHSNASSPFGSFDTVSGLLYKGFVLHFRSGGNSNGHTRQRICNPHVVLHLRQTWPQNQFSTVQTGGPHSNNVEKTKQQQTSVSVYVGTDGRSVPQGT